MKTTINNILLLIILLFSINTITAQKTVTIERNEFTIYEIASEKESKYYETIKVVFDKYNIIVESKNNFKEYLEILENFEENNSYAFLCKNEYNTPFVIKLDLANSSLYIVYKPKTIEESIIYIDLNS